MALVDQFGQPLRRSELTKEIAAPSVTGVRQVWTESIASGLTPARLAAILRAADANDPHDYLTLAEELEERDPHYGAVLGVRKRAISGLPITVESASDSAEDQRLADEVAALTRKPAFGYLIDDLLDALGKGYSVAEIMWQRGQRFEPVNYKHRDPRWFEWNDTHERLLLRDATSPGLTRDLPAYKFICHVPRMKSGIALRGGLARLIAFSWICKAYTLKDWVAFAEVYGMPLRLGRYGPNATEDDVDVLRQAVANIGSDAAAVLPESMKIEFEQVATGTSSHELFKELVEWVDRQISKAVLGQTMTTEAQSAGLGSQQAWVHNDVRGDILQSDTRQLEDTLERDLVKPYIDLNHGERDEYPRINLQVAEPEDVQGLVVALKELVPLGLPVGISSLYEKIGLPEPDEGEAVLEPQEQVPPALARAVNRRLRATRTARNQSVREDPGELERLAEEAADEWEEQLAPLIDPIERLARQVADAGGGPEQFKARLPELLDEMDASELIRRLATEDLKAFGLGDATDEVE